MADIRCPMCGHNNPEGTVNCVKCGARLVPMGSIGQDTSSSNDAPMNDQDELSSLLGNIVDEGASAGQNTGELDAEILSWLDDDQPEKKDDGISTGDLFEEAQTQSVEDRLSGLLDDIEPPLDEKTITDWLDSTAVDDESDEIPDWMSAVSGELDAQQGEDLLPPLAQEEDETSDEQDAPFDEQADDDDLSLPDWMMDAEEDESPFMADSPTEDAPQLPDWITDVPQAATGELDASAVDDNETELPAWFTQELGAEDDQLPSDADSPPLSTGALPEDGHVNTGELPWMGETSEYDEPEEEQTGQQFWITGELDDSAVDDISPEDLKEDDKLPPSTGTLQDGERVSTGSLPWMDGVSEDEEEEEDVDFELPVSKLLTGKMDKLNEPSPPKKVTTSMLPWMKAESDEQEEEEDQSEPAIDEAESSIVDRFTNKLPKDETTEAVDLPVEEPEDEQISFYEPETQPVEDEQLIEEGEVFEEEELESEQSEKKQDSWDSYLQSDDFSPDDNALPDWFSQTSEAKTPSDLLKQIGADDDPAPVAEEEPEEEQPKKKRGITFGFLRRKKKSEAEEEESEQLPDDVEEESSPPSDTGQDSDDDWDLSSILSDSHPLDEDTGLEPEISEEIAKTDWVIEDISAEDEQTVAEEEASSTFIEKIDDIFEQSEEQVEETGEPEFFDEIIEDSSGEEQESEEDDLSSDFVAPTELPAWMNEDTYLDQQAEDLLDAALNEEDDKSDNMTAGLPEWLDSDNAQQEDTLQDDIFDVTDEMMDSIQEAVPESELPDWLSDAEDNNLSDQAEEPLVEETEEASAPEEPESAIDLPAGLPAWMDDDMTFDTEEAESPFDDILPSIVNDEEDQGPVEEESIEAAVIDETVEPEEDTAILPDWLNDVVEEESSVQGEDSAFSSLTDEEPQELTIDLTDQVDVDDTAVLPDWMTEMGSTHGQTDELLDGLLTPDKEDDEKEEPLSSEDEAFLSDISAAFTDDEFSLDEQEDTSTTALPAWMDDALAEEDAVESASDESIIEEAVAEEDASETAVLPDWMTDMESTHGHTGELLDNLLIDGGGAQTGQPGGTVGLPDWLSEYEDDEDSQAAPESSDEPDELDQWLAQQDDSEEEVPDLFAEQGEEDSFEPIIVTDTAELNNWIDDHGIQSPEEQESAEIDSLDDVIPIDVEKNLPDWVLDLEPDETAPMEPDLVVAGTAELPEWLSGDGESPLEIVDDDELPPMEDGLFDFMDEPEWEESAAVEEEEELSSFERNTAFNFDDFTLEDVEEPEEVDVQSLESIEENYTPSMELDEQSEWLEEYAEDEVEDVVLEDSADPFNISLEDIEDTEEIAYADELPDWVGAMDTEDWGEPLDGMLAVGDSVQSAFDQAQPEIPNERHNIELMERILLSEKGAVPTSRSRRRTRDLSLRLVLSVLLILGVFVGLFAIYPPMPDFIENLPVPVAQFQQNLDRHLQNTNDKPVLLVFDYQPAYHGELSVYAELPLRSLMENNARIFTFSTVPEGPALSQKLLADIVVSNGLVYNTQSQAVSLGYLPGGNAAVRDFSLNMRSNVHGLDVGSSGPYIWDLPTTSDVDSIDDFSMVIVLTDDLDKARLWVEQAALYLPETTPLMMVSSARISPMLKPYLLSGQLDGLIGSPVDIAAYGTWNNQSGDYLYYWRAYQLGIYLMVFTIISGALLQIVKQIVKATRRRGDA